MALGLALARILFLGLLTWFLYQLYRAMQRDLARAAGAGPAAAAVRPVLVVRAGRGMATAGRRFRLDEPLTLGRLPDNLLVLEDDYASGHHARVSLVGGRCVLEDLGSTNGTLVDGRRVSGSVELRPGSTVQIGETVLRLETERE